jgi:hypothetical protein
VERRPGIILNALNQAVLDRIPMNVMDAPLEIVLVSAGVLPEPSLPNRSLAPLDA